VTFTLAHLSDPHVGPVPRPRLSELAGKRLTGYMNWKRGRFRIHDMAMLERIAADIEAARPDHIALTGDLVNIGLSAEFVTARRFIERMGSAHHVSFVPGNHDAYVRAAVSPMQAAMAPWMVGDDRSGVAFPYTRMRDGLALIGVCSGVPTGPFLASGEIGREQAERLGTALDAAAARGLTRVVMIHHPPHRSGASFGRGLSDARLFERTIARHGAELILHGHNHRQSVAWLKTPDGEVPVVGVASASAVPGSPNHLAAWHLYSFEGQGKAVTIDMAVRGLGRDGNIGPVSRQRLLDRHAPVIA
jgi:3',5'-cyclic AMP phosphodiesterase CpdA